MRTILASGLATTLAAFSIHAQDIYMAVVTTESPEVRSAPPHGPFDLLIGEELIADKVLGEGKEVRVLDSRTYGGFSGLHVWYRVDHPEDRTLDVDLPEEIWIYGGVLDKAETVERHNAPVAESGASDEDSVVSGSE